MAPSDNRYQDMHFSSLPEPFVMSINNCFAWAHLQTALLDLECLRTAIAHDKEKEIRADWLHQNEQKRLQSLHHEKRHLEWLGGRICAKQAAMQYLDDRYGKQTLPATKRISQLQIITATSGRPSLEYTALPADQGLPHISISHSRGYALAVAASSPCGVDIQAVSETLIRVKERFCTGVEEKILGQGLHSFDKLPPPQHLALLWAAKEAVKKGALFDHMPGFLDLVLTHIEHIPQAISPTTDTLAACLFTLDYHGGHLESCASHCQFQVVVGLHQGYGIGLCIIPPQPSPGINYA